MAISARIIERDPRYLVVDQSAVEISIQTSDYEDAEVDAVLLDISAGGAKLKTGEPLPQGKQLALQLNSPELNGVVRVDATVCWTQLGSKGEWILGCCFEPKIPCMVLDQLAKVGVFDRREDRRQDVDISSTAAWELAADVASVCIVDISPRGFCLVSQQPGKPGANVMLKFLEQEDQAVVTGRCRWQTETEQGFSLGCEFASTKDYTTLRRIQTTQDAQHSAEKRGLFGRLFNIF